MADDDLYALILKQRGIEDPARFFAAGEDELRDPGLFHGMERASSRVSDAIRNHEKIMVYGDYDCDGITAIAVMVQAFKKHGVSVDYALPDRFEEGYGLNARAVASMIDQHIDLVITVDNGITSVDEVKALNQAGIDCIITDHHEPKTTLPDAWAIVHPAMADDAFRDIAGVMVAYKLMRSVFNDTFPELHDLVAIGTVADMMPLMDENRAMVNLGLKSMIDSSNPGLRALLLKAGIKAPGVKDISFFLAPRINSAGRMGKAEEAVRLLVADDESEADTIVNRIERLHQDRKKVTDETTEVARDLVNKDDDVLVVASPLFHEGVIGISAQKLVEEFQKSTLVIALDDDGNGKGSMRSFGDDDVLSMLADHASLLTRFGGHKQACGLQIDADRIPDLRDGLNRDYVRMTEPILNIDAWIDPEGLSLKTVRNIAEGAFHDAMFLIKDMKVTGKRSLSDRHTKITLKKGNRVFDALDFNRMRYYWRLERGDVIDVVVLLSVNEWQGRTSVQFIIRDVACHHRQWLDFRNEMTYYQGMPHLTDDVLLINDDLYLLDDFVAQMRDHASDTICFVPNTNRYHLHRIKDKQLFSRAYALVRKQPLTTAMLAESLGEHTWLAREILRVFRELGFVKADSDGRWTLTDHQNKKSLASSKRYKQLQALTKFIVWYGKAPKKDLVNYFITLLEDKS